MPKNLDDIVRWGFGLFVVGASSVLLSTMKEISNSINELNTKVAVVITTVAGHEKVLDRYEVRIDDLERKMMKRR